MTANKRPPRHRPIHARPQAEQIATWRRFQAAFNPRPAAAERGYDEDWQALRRSHLREEPHCRACAEAGKVRQAVIVDHIKPVATHPDLRLEPSNLQSLCIPCHNAKTNRGEGGFGRPRRAPG